MNSWRMDSATLVLRLACGLIFIPHGVGKVFGSGGVATFAQSLPSYGIPTLLGYIAAYSELIGGILLILGLLTRIDAALLAGTMFVAAFVVQLPDALHDPDNVGKNKAFAAIRSMELPLGILAAMLALVLLGGGRWSLDALIFRKKEAATAPPPQ
jgi:putative oxidoreductase